jgi:hypothetical protein
VQAIPFVGGAVSEGFQLAFSAPLERRRVAWMREVSDTLTLLIERSKDVSLERLLADERFVSVLVQATVVALRNHDQEKLASLRNAVANCAAGVPFPDDLKVKFLNWIDELTPWSLALLRFAADPYPVMAARGIAPSAVEGPPQTETYFFATFPEFRTEDGRSAFDAYVHRDLSERRLIRTAVVGEYHGRCGLVPSPIGERFLAFISSPVSHRT